MKYRLLFYGLFFGMISQYICSQSNGIEFIWDSIFQELKIPENIYYENIESAFSSDEITIKVIRQRNIYDEQLVDFCYILDLQSYQITLYKSAMSNKYYIIEIEIDINKNITVKSLFMHQYLEQFKENEEFGSWMDGFSNDNELVYEIDEGWNFITLFFSDNKLNKVRMTFRLE
jgi:hypothetical protein